MRNREVKNINHVIRSNNTMVLIHATMAILTVHFANVYASGFIQPSYCSHCQMSSYKIIRCGSNSNFIGTGTSLLYTGTTAGTRRRESHLLSLSQNKFHDNAHSFVEDQDEDENNHTPTLSWEDSMKQMAADALLSVFYPIPTTRSHIPTSNNKNATVHSCSSSSSSSSNLQNVQSHSGNYMDPEKALKKLLRLYQKSISEDDVLESTTVEERRASRKMLADLVLGTSIKRLSYFHRILTSTAVKGNDVNNEIMMLEPIMGFQGFKQFGSYSCLTDDCDLEPDEFLLKTRMQTVRAMVDMHSKYTDNEKEKQKMETDFDLIDDDIHRISIRYSLPIFFVKMMIQQYGEEVAEKMANIFNEPGPITIRRNSMRCPSDKILCDRLWEDDSITTIQRESENAGGCIRMLVTDAWSPSKKSIWSLQAWKEGWFEVQDAGSQMIARATEAKYGDIVVDYCAGNGGKTFAIASQINQSLGAEESIPVQDEEGRGDIIAHDIIHERLRQLRGSFARIGLDTSSSTTPSAIAGIVKTTLDPGICLENEMADIVLVDAPCSSTGVLRRRPSQRFKLREDEIKNGFPSIQASILKEGSRLVKVGGILVYATCSILHQENKDVVDAFESDDDFIDEWERWHFHHDPTSSGVTNLHEYMDGHCQTLLPHENDSDGFFIARWKRI